MAVHWLGNESLCFTLYPNTEQNCLAYFWKPNGTGIFHSVILLPFYHDVIIEINIHVILSHVLALALAATVALL